MKNALKSILFKKYIASYILVFSIPFLVLILVLNHLYINTLREEVNATNENYLEYSNQLLNEQIVEIRSVGNYINETDILNQYSSYLIDSHNNYRELISQYEHSSQSIEALYIVLTDNSYVFSSRGNMTIEAMLNYSIHFDHLPNKEQLYEQITNAEERVVSHDKSLIYMMPFYNKSRQVGTLVFSMNSKPLLSQLNMIAEREEGFAFIMDENKEMLMSSAFLQDEQKHEINQLSETILDNSQVKVEGKQFFTSHIQNDLTNWTFVNLIDSHQFNQPIRQGLIVLGSSLSVLTVLGILLSVYLADRQYKPLKTVLSRIGENTSSKKDEWQIITDSFQKNEYERVTMDKRLKKQAPIIRNAALLDLLEGRLNRQEETAAWLSQKGIGFSHKLLTVLVIEIKSDMISPSQLREIEKLKQAVTKLNTGEDIHLEIATPYLKNNQVFLIINSNYKSKQDLKPVIDNIYNYFTSHVVDNAIDCRIGVGTSYTSVDKLSNSYIEANSSLEYIPAGHTEKEAILFFCDVAKAGRKANRMDKIIYPEENMMLLYQSIKQGNQTIADEQLNDIFTSLKQENMPVIGIETVVSALFNDVIKIGNDLSVKNHQAYIYELESFSNLKKAQNILLKMTDSIIKDTQIKQDQHTDKIGKDIAAYIIENYNHPGLSLEQIAADYDISLSYASKLVKEETGKSFSSIVQSLRMKQFKMLLTTTKKPIKELVLEVGYYDVSNFTRKFRKENEMTPSQYRKNFKKSDS